MLLIDALIHGFHWTAKYGSTRPVAINLIEGRLADVIRFLDQLTYEEASTPGVAEQREAWTEESRNVRRWSGLPMPARDAPGDDGCAPAEEG